MRTQHGLTGEIASNMHEAARGAEQVARSSVEASQKAGKSAEASSEVLAIVDGATHAAKTLEQDIDGFLQKIAAA
jgi:methyl-accepting chemotaxis protein